MFISNAGIFRDEVLDNIDYESIQAQLNVNALGPLKVTEALKNKFTDNAKLSMVSSLMGSITDNTSGGHYGYRMSKAALNAVSMSFTHNLKNMGVAVAVIHQGLVGTEILVDHDDTRLGCAEHRRIELR